MRVIFLLVVLHGSAAASARAGNVLADGELGDTQRITVDPPIRPTPSLGTQLTRRQRETSREQAHRGRPRTGDDH
jgi:hypothetical protein